MNQYRELLISRKDQGNYFWELRSCKYWSDFESNKIILGRFMNSPLFTLDKHNFFHNDALYMIPNVAEYEVSVLNSSTGWWFLTQICTDLANGYLQAFRGNLFQIPIPDPKKDPDRIAQIESLVQQILDQKQTNPAADVSAIEREIDQHIYQLYDLTIDEIQIIETSTR